MSRAHRKLLRLVKDYRCGTGIFAPPPRAMYCVRITNMPRSIDTIKLTEKAAAYMRLLNEALNTPESHSEIGKMFARQIEESFIDIPNIYGESPTMKALADCEALRRFEMIPSITLPRNQ